MLDPFRSCLAFGPVAIYLFLLAAINLFRRPFLVSGSRDAAAVVLAVSGLVFVGPIDLFLPVATSIAYGPFVWVFLTGLYAMLFVLVLLIARPRLVIYNISTDELRPILANLAVGLDGEPRWAGDALALPNLGVQLYLETARGMRNVSLIATTAKQNHQGWRRLEVALANELSNVEVRRNFRAARRVGGLANAIGLGLIVIVARDPQAVAASLYGIMQSMGEVGQTLREVFHF